MDLELRPQLPPLSCDFFFAAFSFFFFVCTSSFFRVQKSSLVIPCCGPGRTMALWRRSPLLVALPLWMSFGRAAALSEPEICYVLDGILILYGIILTALYCRLKIRSAKKCAEGKTNGQKGTQEGIYTGLTPHAQDTYAIIDTKK
ncbi:high affinity immunoglobulin epsilon receptor subunit gamma [Festucalex cinctus]